MSDELYELRNNLLLGNFNQVVAEGQSVRCASKKPEDVLQFNADRDLLVAKAQIGLQQYDSVLADLRTATRPALICVRNLAAFHKDLAAGRSEAAERLLNESILPSLGDAPSASLGDNAVMVCSALIAAGNAAGSLKISATWSAALDPALHSRLIIELRALSVDALLRLHRADLADKEIATMRAVDDDAIQTLFCATLVNLRLSAVAPERLRDASNWIQEIIGRCCVTVSLLNLQALCFMNQGKFAEAERCLIDALGKRSGDADTCANLAVVSSQMGKTTDATARLIGQSKHAANGHMSPWSKAFDSAEARFSDASKTVGMS